MSRASERLREFHEAFGVEGTADPARSTIHERRVLAKRRLRLHDEEHDELRSALPRAAFLYDGRMEALARELADDLVIAYGTADLFGIDLDAAFEAVMDANMAKLPDCTHCQIVGDDTSIPDPLCPACNGTGKGKPIKRASDQKVLKPEGWQEPDMSGAIR